MSDTIRLALLQAHTTPHAFAFEARDANGLAVQVKVDARVAWVQSEGPWWADRGNRSAAEYEHRKTAERIAEDVARCLFRNHRRPNELP